MKLTTKQLKQIIQEELADILPEGLDYDWKKGWVHPVIKYKTRRKKRAQNHPDPKIRELAKHDINQAMDLVDMIDGEMEPLEGEQKEWNR